MVKNDISWLFILVNCVLTNIYTRAKYQGNWTTLFCGFLAFCENNINGSWSTMGSDKLHNLLGTLYFIYATGATVIMESVTRECSYEHTRECVTFNDTIYGLLDLKRYRFIAYSCVSTSPIVFNLTIHETSGNVFTSTIRDINGTGSLHSVFALMYFLLSLVNHLWM